MHGHLPHHLQDQENVADRRRGAKIARILVNTGSEYTWVPEVVLERVRVAREKKDVEFVMANGQRITRTVEFGIVRLDRYFTVEELVFAQKGDMTLLGARTLEGLNLAVDSRRKRLVGDATRRARLLLVAAGLGLPRRQHLGLVGLGPRAQHVVARRVRARRRQGVEPRDRVLGRGLRVAALQSGRERLGVALGAVADRVARRRRPDRQRTLAGLAALLEEVGRHPELPGPRASATRRNAIPGRSGASERASSIVAGGPVWRLFLVHPGSRV